MVAAAADAHDAGFLFWHVAVMMLGLGGVLVGNAGGWRW